MTDVASLNKQFGIPGAAQVVAGHGGLPAVQVTGKDGAGMIYLHGGHVTSWKPAGGEEVLWCSDKSWWVAEKPIRGGVPLCFPWFGAKEGDAAAPAHGFARLLPWQLESIQQQGGDVMVTVCLRADAATKKWWPHDFTLRHRVTFGRELVMQLELTNTSSAPFSAEEAQHTYFAVKDVRQVRVTGLAGVTYRSKVEGGAMRTQEGDIRITAETDRLFLDTQSPLVLEDPALHRRITINKRNSRTTVVWNPWIAKAKAMPDFGNDEWPEMICIETCNAAEFAAKVQPGETHIMASRIQVDRVGPPPLPPEWVQTARVAEAE